MSKALGSILIVTGTAVGAGMLAIPMVTYGAGFIVSAIALVVCWVIMALTALLIIEVNLAMKPGANFSSMAYQTIGPIGQSITWVIYLLLLYALTAAYISGGGALLQLGLTHLHYHISIGLSCLLFTFVLGMFVISGTRAVDWVNRCLILLKGIAFLFVVVVLAQGVNSQLITGIVHTHLIWFAIPIIITSFGFHIVIPSLRDYMGGRPKRLVTVVILGSVLPLLIYLLWEVVTLGVLPLLGPISFNALSEHHGSVGAFINSIQQYTHRHVVSVAITIFSDVAITTSFLGVTLSLLAFCKDGFRLRKRTISHQSLATLITYLPPLAFAIFYPHGFVLALEYASIFVCLLLIILPGIMALRLRATRSDLNYRAPINTIAIWLLMLMGVVIIVLQFLSW